MYTSFPVLTSAGAGVCAIVPIRSLIVYFGYVDFASAILPCILSLAFWVIMSIAGINKKNARQLSFIASGVAVLKLVVYFIDSRFYGTIWNYMMGLLIIVGSIMIGLACDCVSANPKVSASVSSSIAVFTIPVESQIDRLTKLKDLLDKKIITQEEFETKKKQILGQ